MRTVLEIDDKPGFCGRFQIRPPSSVIANVFYYDNRGMLDLRDFEKLRPLVPR